MSRSVATLLRQAVERLAAAGVPDPQGDARRLMAHALQLGGALPLPPAATVPDPGAQRAFARAVAARAARQPVSQILGRRMFWGHDFEVTRDVLDPRPETEALIAAALAQPFARVLDLGTGSGAILLTLLAERPAARGTGVELSAAALAVARRNAARLGVADRAELRPGDWCAGLAGRFDLVVSNPPYIAAAELPGLAPEVRDWEPAEALCPGGDGLGAYRAIAAGVAGLMAPDARLLLEIGPTQAAEVGLILSGNGLAPVALHRDLDGRPRVVEARTA